MKKTLLLLITTLFFMGCSDEDTVFDNPSNTDVNIISDDIKSVAQLYGLDQSTIVDKGDYYLIEGDIAFKKADIPDYLSLANDSAAQLRHATKSGRTLSYAKASNITVRIDNSVPTSGRGKEWRDGLLRAIAAWNNIPGSIVKFTLTTASNANITLKSYFEGYNGSEPPAFAYTSLPQNDIPPSALYVNMYWNEGTSLDQKTNTLIHELGHTVGLLHTHNTPKEEGGILIPGTPEIDDTSIMSYNRNRSLYPGFNYNDIHAISSLYFNYSPLTFSKSNVCENETVEYTLSNYSGTPRWFKIKNAVLVSGEGTSRATFRLYGNGFAEIAVNANFGGINYPIPNYKVWVGEPDTPQIRPMVSRFNSGCSYEVYISYACPNAKLTYSVIGATITGQYNSMITLKVANFGYDGSVNISVTATNSCGTSTNSISIPVRGTGGGSGGGGGIYPEI